MKRWLTQGFGRFLRHRAKHHFERRQLLDTLAVPPAAALGQALPTACYGGSRPSC